MSSFDQRDQNVGKQYNLNVSLPPSPDPVTLFKQGMSFLEAQSYSQAINAFKATIEVDPSIGYAYYYLALALLRGERPKLLKRDEIDEIDQLLNSAAYFGDSDAVVQWFRALLRDDYYVGNRISKYPPPLVTDLVQAALNNTTDIDRLKALLIRLPMSNNQLYAALVNQIV